jgi:hypothetical protein
VEGKLSLSGGEPSPTPEDTLMNRKRGPTSRAQRMIRVWTYQEARNLLPYVASVLRSLREHRLDAARHAVTAKRLADKPGRPDRAALLAQEEAVREARLAEERYQEALAELEALDIRCPNPIAGRALIPFVQDEQLAWFIFDLFDPEPLRFWRYNTDPLKARRAITKEQKEHTAESTWTV